MEPSRFSKGEIRVTFTGTLQLLDEVTMTNSWCMPLTHITEGLRFPLIIAHYLLILGGHDLMHRHGAIKI